MKSFFNLLRGKKTRPLPKLDGSAIPTSSEEDKLVIPPIQIEPQQFNSAAGQSNGKQRDHNEDSLFTFCATIGGESPRAPLGVFIIADGMGGHQYGEVASSTAIRTMANSLIEPFHTYVTTSSEGMEEPLQEIMRSAIEKAQLAVIKAAPGSGTTMTAALVLGQQMTIGHVGDSRAFAIYQDGRVNVLTRDHSLVKRLEELGQISPDEAAVHPQRNVLYRALGQGEVLEPDVFTTSFPQPGYLLLCSDGLWSVLPANRLFEIINSAPNLHRACQDLIAAANEAGGPDNISVILVQLLGS